MIERQVSLEDVFSDNDIVFVDGSAFSHTDLPREIYDKGSFCYIDNNSLKFEMSRINYALEIMNNINTRVTPEVVKEIWEYGRILGDTISNISNKDRGRDYRYHKKKHIPKRKMINNESSTHNKELLEDLQKNAYSLFQMCSRKKFEIKDNKFDFMLEMIKLLDQKIGLQRDFSYNYGEHDLPRTNFDTDDKLVASLYWKSLFTNEKSSILTGDSDIERILGVSSRLLGSEFFLPYNELFRDKLNFNPCKLYFSYEECLFEKNFSPYHYDKDFLIRKISYGENIKVRESIKSLWIKFSDS